MQLDVRRQGIDIDETSRDRLARRVEFALGRLGQHVSRVSVHLAEGHKHHGGSEPDDLVPDAGEPGAVVRRSSGAVGIAFGTGLRCFSAHERSS